MKNNSTYRKAVKPAIGLGMVVLTLSSLGLALFSGGMAVAGPAIGLSQFQQLWDRSDKPVAEGKVSRSWTWGPTLTDVLTETYTQGGSRKVQYFDKTRMEQTEGRPVTNGLLAKELLTGLLQRGDETFKQFPPDNLRNIAGDQGNTVNPIYASFRKVATISNNENRAADRTGQPVSATITREGTTGDMADLFIRYNVKNAYFDNTLGHNIADVLWNFMNETGPVYRDGNLTNDRVFDWLVAIGLPLTEPYWTRSVLKGQTQDILVQVFERRVLTYTPSNDAGFRVEMGNVGQHYRDWRVSVGGDLPDPTPTPVPPTPTATPNVASLPIQPAWTTPTLVGPSSPGKQQLWSVSMRARPTDGVGFVMGETGSGSAVAPAGAVMIVRSDDPGQMININDAENNGNKFPRMAFTGDGSAYAVWRNLPKDSGYRAYLRRIAPDGALDKGIDLGALYKQVTGTELDQPNIAYSTKADKIYVVGQWQTNPPGVSFAEITNGGRTLVNPTTLFSNRPPNSYDTHPQICVDPDDNIHMATMWGQGVFVRSRINGNWSNPVQIDGPNLSNNYTFRGEINIACGADGYAYVVYDGFNSFGLGRYTPGEGWRRLSGDVFPNITSQGIGVTVSADGKLWIAMGVNAGNGAPAGTNIAASSNHGSSFTIQQVIARAAANPGVDIVYSPFNNRLYVSGTFKEPGPRETFFVATK